MNDVKAQSYNSENYAVTVKKGDEPAKDIYPARITSIFEEVMSWTNAYQIHHWIHEALNSGAQDGEFHHLTKWQLQRLAADCKAVIANSILVYPSAKNGSENQSNDTKVIEDTLVARRELPIIYESEDEDEEPAESDYNEHYLRQVIETRNWLEREIEFMDESAEYKPVFYSFSW